MARHVDLKNIHPQGGDRRDAFEELSFLLFSREHGHHGTPIRRHGAGGDAGLEGYIADSEGQVLKGLQAKFFDSQLGASQWKNLEESLRTAISDNAATGTLLEVVVTFPRDLTKSQNDKWSSLKQRMDLHATACGYGKPITFTLWGESTLRNILLQPANRGLLLHYFEYPDFDRDQCTRKTLAAINALGDRYQPALHTVTEAEDMVHTFLRSERLRLHYVEEAQSRFGKNGLGGRTAEKDWNDELRRHHDAVMAVAARIRPHLGDGVSLPQSLSALADSAEHVAKAYGPLLDGLRKLVPPQEPGEQDEWRRYESRRHPARVTYENFANDARSYSSFAYFLRDHAAADTQCLLFFGEPGRGKTHVLAEVCLRYSEQGGAVLFMEGGMFQAGEPLWKQIMQWADFSGGTTKDFLATLAALSEATGLKALICIDALNETSDRNLWRNGLLQFAKELADYPQIKLIVSCRQDYLRQTLPKELAEGAIPGWATAEHEGLGVDVLEALPKYLKAYDVRGFALPPLTHEFGVPLFLRIFCEAYSGQTPDEGSLSLPVILKHFASRKAETIGQRIDCEQSQVIEALKEIAAAMLASGNLCISDGEARRICQKHHAVPEASRSLYRALLSESILAEAPESTDILAIRQSVRFTYERVWDYFLSVHVMPHGSPLEEQWLAKLRDYHWRLRNAGVLSLLSIRLPEERQEELWDLVSSQNEVDLDLRQAFLESLAWRTPSSMTTRAEQLFRHLSENGYLNNEYDHIVSYAAAPAHPWNARWLHQALLDMPLADRDRTWTFWVNECLVGWSSREPLEELLSWAQRGDLTKVPEEQLLLLAVVLAWCLSTTVVEERTRLAESLTRVVAGRASVAAKLLEHFTSVDDPYIKERVLLACAGAAQHAPQGDAGLRELARITHQSVFAGGTVEPHLLVRHYASEVCCQAEAKGVLDQEIAPQSFRPPWKSKWPRIWSAKKVAQYKSVQEKTHGAHHLDRLYSSVEPGPGFGYGDWGRYVMESYVHHFQNIRLREQPDEGRNSRFDAQTAKRYVIQRVLERGWDCRSKDTHPDGLGESRGEPRVERLSKKYQWIALYELLGHLSDHYHFIGWSDNVRIFRSAKDIDPRDLLDPFVIQRMETSTSESWRFTKELPPWWRGHFDPFPRPLADDEQRSLAQRIELDDPRVLIDLNDGKHEWLTLFAYHRWNEPTPVWKSRDSSPHLDLELAIQSYLVSPASSATLIRNLSHSHVESSRWWFEEPEFGQPKAILKSFPNDQGLLEAHCCLNNWRETKAWQTGAISTTCRFDESDWTKSGSIPSPQLARLGNLSWTGSDFDFSAAGSSEVLFKHMGRGFKKSCIVRKDALLNWLSTSGQTIVWRCYANKFRSNGYRPGDHHARIYWATFTLDGTGRLKLCKGATVACPSMKNKEEKLPWV